MRAALAAASAGPVAEGSVGSGTGMICHEFKGGIGTASRRVSDEEGGFTVGCLVQANHGRRSRLRVNGAPVGELIGAGDVPLPEPPLAATVPGGGGSIIVVLATDAPLLATQCDRLAQRGGLGIARTGGVGEHFSGDLFLAFATGNRGRLHCDRYDDLGPLETEVRMLGNAHITPLFDAAIEATEEAILNALVANESMTGRDDVTAHALPHDRLLDCLRGR